jgi:hypothetical protein
MKGIHINNVYSKFNTIIIVIISYVLAPPWSNTPILRFEERFTYRMIDPFFYSAVGLYIYIKFSVL